MAKTSIKSGKTACEKWQTSSHAVSLILASSIESVFSLRAGLCVRMPVCEFVYCVCNQFAQARKLVCQLVTRHFHMNLLH